MSALKGPAKLALKPSKPSASKHEAPIAPPALDHGGFVVLRTPLLALEEIAWLHEARSTDDDLFARRAAVRAELERLLARPEIVEALRVASASLSARIGVWRADPESSEGQKIEAALVRYVLRMAWRPTPFGLLAGVTRGAIGETSRLRIAARATYRRGVRLDNGVSRALADAALADPIARARIHFVPNRAMYMAGGRWQVPRVVDKGETRTYEQTAVTPDEALDRALARAREEASGATLRAIAEALVPMDVTIEEALAYVDELASAGLLEPTAVPTITGADFVAPLEEAVGQDSAVGRALAGARAAIRALDGLPLGAVTAAYDPIADIVGEALPKLDRKNVVQVDLAKPGADTVLGRGIVDEIAKGIGVLHTLFGAREEAPALVAFRRAFERRYEARAVPLMEVLDDELGIGFPEPQARTLDPVALLAGLGLPLGQAHSFPQADAWTPLEAFLLEKLQAAWSTGASAIEIHPHDLRRFDAEPRLPLPDSLAAVVTVHAKSDGDSDFTLAWNGAVGPSGARLVARFCPWDETMTNDVKTYLAREEAHRPDAIHAEIVHLPDTSRAGNVLLRPVLRDHEISFCARGGAPDEKQLRLDDLLVRIDGDRIVLSSRSLGREVIPRLSSAHNTLARQLPVYRFLSRLQDQGVSSNLAWTWGPFSQATKLPRVVYGRNVLAPAKWWIDERWIASLTVKDARERFAAAQRLREKLDLPRFVALEDGDNVLPVDFESSIVVDAWIDALRGRTGARLVEILGATDDDVVRGPEGRFRHELVVPFVKPAPHAAPARAKSAAAAAPSSTIRHLPGGEWLYAKLYCGRRAVDRVLASCVVPAVHEAIESKAADAWFFVRYADPDPHVRVRVHGDPARLAAEVLPRLVARTRALVDEGLVQRVQIDTYEPEVERYGGLEGLAIAEQIFHADSVLATRLLACVAASDDPEKARWAAACASLDGMLDDADLDPAARIAFIGGVRAGFEAEMKATGDREHAIAKRYREQRAFLEKVLGDEPPAPFDTARIAIAERSRHLRPCFVRLRELARAGNLIGTFEGVLSSHLHMCANRLLHTDARQQELVLATFLERTYLSRAARRRS